MTSDGENKTNPKVALIAALLVLGFVVFVALVPSANSNPTIQGMTGLIVMAGIAVVLFSAVPSSATVKTVGAVGGAAAFFLLGIEPLERFIFPLHTITGTIYYEKTTIGVPGASVRDPETRQEVQTDQQGDFILPNASRAVRKLTVKSGGEDYEITLTGEKKYAVIKRPTIVERSQAQPIPAERWEVKTKHGCPTPAAPAGGTIKLHLMRDTVSIAENYARLYVQVNAPPGTQIVHAEKLAPPQGTGGESVDSQTENPEGDPRMHKWWVPATDREVRLELAVCLREEGRRGGGVARVPVNLDAKYWFEREVEQK